MNMLRAAILDWAGTVVDWGCQAPVVILQEMFDEEGVPIEVAEARTGMGLLKKDQIRMILRLPRVSEAWTRAKGVPPGDADLQRLFAMFGPMQTAVVERYSGVLPHVVEAAEMMRSRGMKIGSTTGYTRPMLDRVMAQAKQQGYWPDCSVTPEEAGGGRPYPWMVYRNLMELKTFPLAFCVKVGDTPADMAEGRNAGMWTVGVTMTSNQIGLTEKQWRETPLDARRAHLDRAAGELRAAGANYILESMAGLETVLDDIESRLLAGQGPSLPPLSLVG